ncbi:MAG TPA: rhomboid family intramembrane serine protease [Thermoanaerobaculia bacterium]|nr:rhomboid family intramembrane serine protease [Thermoanaerobaculia bacterium]
MRSRFPWLTAGVVALCLAASLAPAETFQYDRARVEAGEIWRLLTGQMLHWTARMAALDLGMLLVLGGWLEMWGDRRSAALALLLGAGSTALAVHFLSPRLSSYRGSSGLASALFILAALRVVRSAQGAPRALALLAMGMFLAKAAWELVTRQTIFAGPLPAGVEVVPLVHLFAGLAGAAAAGLEWTDRQRESAAR